MNKSSALIRRQWASRFFAFAALGMAFAAGWHYGPGRATPGAISPANRRALAKTPRVEPKAPPPVAPKIPPWDDSSPLAKALFAPVSSDRLIAVQQLVDRTPVDQLSTLLDQAAAAPR